MSDRFKFRVWDNVEKKYVNGIAINEDGGLCSPMVRKVEDFTIEQCTGIRDRTGRMIYEGDVVEVKPWRGQIGHMNHRWYAFDGCCAVELPTIDANKIEIVGNVHEVKK